MPIRTLGNENSSNEKTNIDVEQYVSHFAEIWHDSNIKIPALGSIHPADEKLTNEYELERFYKIFRKRNRKLSYYSDENALKNDKLFRSVKKFLECRMNFTKSQLDILISRGFFHVTNEFIEKARNFNPSLNPKDLSQAIRNVWTMNWLQLLFGLKIELTPSVFAYSMLYPYTDNYLDDPNISTEGKKHFNLRLTERLKGKQVNALNQHERVIHSLIGMIESQFNRRDYPKVYESLLSIHAAQEKSLQLSDPGSHLSFNDILQVSIEKGGTSVLTDGFLVSGNLTGQQMLFLFGFGAYLQLVDDLQDMGEDSRQGCSTVFLQATGNTPLDILVNQTYNFGNKVLAFYYPSENRDQEQINSIMQKCSRLILVEAIGQSNTFFSTSFINQIEKYSFVHFSFLRKYQNNLMQLALSLLE